MKKACTHLLLDRSEFENDSCNLAVANRNSKSSKFTNNKRKYINSNDEYMPCDFIRGSVPDIERLFSKAGYILTTYRREMTHIVFESLLFLNINRSYWDGYMVRYAMERAHTEKVPLS